MKEYLEKYQFKEKKMKADGNCQFRALSDQLFGTENSYLEVRKAISDWLRQNGRTFDIDDEGTTLVAFLASSEYKTWEDYCYSMATAGAW